MTADRLILEYDFSKVNSTIVADSSGNGQAGVIRNFDRGGAEIHPAKVFGRDISILHLAGGADSGYLQFPDGVLGSSSSCTVSFLFRCTDSSGRQTLFSLGSDNIVCLLAEPVSESSFSCCAAATMGGISQAAFSEGVVLNTGVWYFLTLTFDTAENGNRLTIYVNGLEKTSFAQKKLSCSALGQCEDCFIGNGPFTHCQAYADFGSVYIWNTALSAEEVSQAFDIAESERIAFDLSSLDYLDGAGLEHDIVLPSAGTYGTCFIWSSSDESRISCTGKILRPAAGSSPARISLTVQASYGECVCSRSFSVIILPFPSASDIIRAELNSIAFPFSDSIISDIELPAMTPSGAAITWESSSPEIIGTDGRVTRPGFHTQSPVCDAKVILRAAARGQGVCVYRDFSFTVPAMRPARHIVSADSVTVQTACGTAPLLPSRIKVLFDDGHSEFLNVSWQDTENLRDKGSVPGTHNIAGQLTGTGFAVNASVRFISDSDGAQLPKKRRGRHVSLSDVLLKGHNVFTVNRDGCLEYLKNLDCDRMLYNFRVTFGEDTKGTLPPGGWDEPSGLLRGHSTGHFLSALALSYASTGDVLIKEKIDYMILELNRLQKKSGGNARDFVTACTPSNASQKLWSRECSTWGRGYIGAYPPDQFALLEQFTPYATIWAPYYTLHKILAGFIDCYTYAGSTAALESACLLGDWVSDRLSGTTPEQRSRMWSMYIAGEYGGINESLAALTVITGRKSYLETAAMFDNPKVFDGLSVNLDTISGIHANQHIPQIIGALKRFEADRDIRYYRIAHAFWKIVTDHYAYSIAGVGRGEVFKEPDILAGNIDADRNCETCATYNMLKLTGELYSYEPDNSEYMDYYERGLINHIAASRNPVVTKNMHNGVTYMLPIGPGVHREYSSDYDDFTCCHGTGMENHVKYQEQAFFVDESNKRIYVNLYLDMQLRSPVCLTLRSDDAGCRAVIDIASDSDFMLCFRVPYWASNGMSVEINGETVCSTDSPSGYLMPGRECHKGDHIVVRYPYSVRLEMTPDLSDGTSVASVCYGPYVMAAVSDSSEWITLSIFPNVSDSFTVSMDKENSYPVLRNGGLVFIPMYAANNISYHTYFKIRQL